MLPRTDRAAVPRVVGEIHQKIGAGLTYESTRHIRHQILVTDQWRDADSAREIERDRAGAGGKAIGDGKSRQKRQDLGKGQILAEGEQHLLMIVREDASFGVGEESRVECLGAGTAEGAAKTLS